MSNTKERETNSEAVVKCAFIRMVSIFFVCALLGLAFKLISEESKEQEKYRAETIQEAIKAGRSEKEIENIIRSMRGEKSIGDKRAELVRWLSQQGHSSERIPNIVSACYSEEDFNKVKVK